MTLFSSLTVLPLIVIHLITANPGEDASRQVNITWHASQSGTKLYLRPANAQVPAVGRIPVTSAHEQIPGSANCNRTPGAANCNRTPDATIAEQYPATAAEVQEIEITPEEELWSYEKGDSLFQQPRYICRARLDCLQPGTKYYYYIDGINQRMSFTTASGPQTKEWSFLAFADFQHPFNETSHKAIATGMILKESDSGSSVKANKANRQESETQPITTGTGNAYPPAGCNVAQQKCSIGNTSQQSGTGNDIRLMICSGDLTGTAANESEWRWLLDNPVFNDLIFAAAPGDHEHWNIKPKGEVHIPQMLAPLTYNAIFSNPQNGCNEYKNSNYYFYYNNVLFVSLNCGDSNTYMCPQFVREADWFRKTIIPLKGSYDYLVVFGHKSIYGSYKEDSGVRKYFTPLWYPVFDEAGVDLVVSGHDHMYSRTYALKRDRRATSDITQDTTTAADSAVTPEQGKSTAAESLKGLGTWYLDLGSSGNKYRSPDQGLYDDGLHALVFDLKAYPQTLGAKISVSENEMKVVVFNQNGETFDSFTIKKK